MQDTASVRPQLVESLYVEALALSDEVRAVFARKASDAAVVQAGVVTGLP